MFLAKMVNIKVIKVIFSRNGYIYLCSHWIVLKVWIGLFLGYWNDYAPGPIFSFQEILQDSSTEGCTKNLSLFHIGKDRLI